MNIPAKGKIIMKEEKNHGTVPLGGADIAGLCTNTVFNKRMNYISIVIGQSKSPA